MDLGGALNAKPHVSQSAEKTIYTLSQLGESLKRTLERVTEGRALWFKAEISKLTTGPTGHVYLDLVEEKDGRRLAVMRGTLWRGQADVVKAKLGDNADQILQAGSEIVFSGRVNYHAVFGVSLVIEDIDLDAMVGEAERRKQATLATLKKEGALATNGLLPMPRLVQRIALVGSPGTSGFRDFGVHLLRNEWGLGFDVEVFPTSVQGKHAPAEIVAALEAAAASVPDVVVLVRGGGSALDLDAFNDLELCRAISRCPIPVLTGIGHESDLSVADLVAHTQFKTPTAVADGLVDKMVQAQSLLLEWTGQMSRHTHQRLAWERERLAHLTQTMRLQPDQMLQAKAVQLGHLRERTLSLAQQALERQTQRIGQLHQTVDALKPDNTLARGFSIARHQGKAVKDAALLSKDDVIDLQFHQGRATAVVTSVTSNQDG